MDKKELERILEDHRKWLSGNGGSRANLRGVDLREADLRGAKDGSICRMDFGGWSICVRSKRTSIGCQNRDNRFWLKAETKDVESMDEEAGEWWLVHGEAVKAAIRVVMEKAGE